MRSEKGPRNGPFVINPHTLIRQARKNAEAISRNTPALDIALAKQSKKIYSFMFRII